MTAISPASIARRASPEVASVDPGVADGELGHGAVERVGVAEITGDLGRVTRAGVGSGEGAPAQTGVVGERARAELVGHDRGLAVPELTDVVGEAAELAVVPPPAEERVGRRLDEALAVDDALTRFAVRSPRGTARARSECRLLDLQEQGVVIARDEQRPRGTGCRRCRRRRP